MSKHIWETSRETAEFLSSRLGDSGSIAMVLGTGLGAISAAMDISNTIDYADIPHFPVSTVASHKGTLSFGTLAGKRAYVLEGRFHRYEGYSLAEATFPIRVFHHLGVKTLILTNACGTVNPLYSAGEVMLIDDHINLMGDNPLIGENDERFGPRFPDMSEPYSQKLLALAERSALELQLKVHRGVYAAVTGPCLETRAEYRYMRTIGADTIGMSTVPENIVARHMNMDVLGLSVITDECFPDSLKPLHLEDVLAAAHKAEPTVTKIISRVVENIE